MAFLKRTLAATLAGLVCISASGQDLPGNPADLMVTQWDTEMGLPHNSVKAIHQTKDGYLWVGTDQGAARFDGIRFSVFDERNTAGHLNGEVTDFAETPDGSLWIATTTGLVRHYRGAFSGYSEADGIRSSTGIINALCVDASGSLWIGTRDGITRWTNGRFINDIDTSAFDMRGIRSLEADWHGAIWISLSNAVLRFEGGKFSRFGEEQGLPKYVTKVVPDATGRVTAVTHSGLFLLTGERFVPFEHNADLASGSANDARLDRAGSLWIGSLGGLDRVTNGAVTACRDRIGHSLGVVYAIFEDREDCIWAGTTNGLYRITKARGHSFATSEGRERIPGLAVTEARDGTLWMSSYGYGVDRIRQGAVTHLRLHAPLSSDIVKCIYEAPDGTMWLGMRGSTIDHLVDGRVTTYVYEPGVATSRPVTCMQVTEEGILLIGISRRGLLQLRNQAVVPVDEAGDLASETVWTIHKSKGGRMLLGTSKGLYELRPDRRIVPIPLKGISSPPAVRAILETNQGAIWLATDGQGLIRWHDGEARAYGPDVGLLDNNFFSVLRDELGNLWVSSTHGIARIREKDFDEVDSGRIATVNCTTFGRADGLISSSSAGVGYPVATLLRDGRLVTGTDRGFAVIVPSAIKTNPHAPNVIIESVTADDTTLKLAAKTIIPAGTNRLEVRFTALSLIAPERVRFRYRLSGSDKTWVEAEHQRSATYTHLPPGSYTFDVLACNNDGVWNELGASQRMEILPKFYQTLAFRLGVIVFGIGVIAGAVGFAVHRRVEEKLRLLEREHALEKERARIARDLHDELGAGLTEAGLLTDQLAESAPAGLSPQLTGLAWRIRRLGTDLSGIVWTMNLKHSSLADLATFIRRYTERFFRHTDIRYKVTGVETIPPFPLGPTTRHEVMAAVKEALNNIISHARASEAEVRFNYSNKVFEVQVGDNGCGFDTTADAEAALNGNGLRNMRTRMEEIRGTIVLTSRPGEGTLVIFQVPCPDQSPPS